MDGIIKEYIEKNQVDHLSLSIMDHGKVVYEYHHKSNALMRYTIGSLSKMFIAVGILQLVEEGLCKLDDSVSLYIPGFYQDITLEMLLNHSCGLDCVNFKGKYTNEPYPEYVDHMIERYKEVPLKSKPGKYSVYTNDGFVIGQRVIEIISGLSFHDYLVERIVKRANMQVTTCPPEKMEEGTYARCTSPFGKEYGQEYVNGIGSGGIYSSSYDLNQFMYALNHHLLLNEESVNNMFASHMQNHIHVDQNITNYGLGLDHVEMPYFKAMGYKAVTKGGATYGYLSNTILIPELDVTVAIVSASLNGSAAKLAKDILGKYVNKEVGKITLKPLERVFDLGIYGNGYRTYNLYMVGDNLQVDYYEDGKFIPSITLQRKGNRFITDDWSGIKDVELSMIQQNGYSYFVLDYMTEVKTRSIYAQKLEEQDCMIDLEAGYYVRNNEYIDQRNMNTQDQLCIYIDQNLYLPYPLKAISQTKAVPYVELPGSYAREMTSLEVIDKTHFKLGFYIYEKLTNRQFESYTIQDEKIQWFKYNGENFKVSDKVRVVGIDRKGKYLYDSNLSNHSFTGDYIGILGAINEEVQVD